MSSSSSSPLMSPMTVPKPADSPAGWSRLWDSDRSAAGSGLIELLLEANGITKKQFLDGATVNAKTLELFMLKVPQGVPVLSLFPNLTTLRLMNIGLRCINFLEPLRSLQTLWLNENELSGEIKPGQLDGLKELRELFLHFNSIERIGPNALLGLNKLEVLWLNENKLCGELTGVAHLKSLRVLNLGNNKISSLTSAATASVPTGSLPPSLVELNLGGNNLERFQHLQPILQLPGISKLALNDPTYGAPNPVCRLSNLQTFLIFHVGRSLTVLDGAIVTQQQRTAARSTYLQKYAFYSMRARTLRNNMRQLEAELGSVARQRAAQILSGTVALQKLLYQLREADCCAATAAAAGGAGSNSNSGSEPPTPVKNNGDGASSSSLFCDGIITAPSSASFASLISPLVEQLVTRLRDALQACDKITALAAQLGDEGLRPVVDEVVRRSLIELHTGGNVRYEEQCAVPSTSTIGATALPSAPVPEADSFVWFRSCVDLFRSRMFLPDFSTKGILDMVVTRVTKIHNKAMRTRFDTTLEELVDVSDPSFKRGIEYLFLVIPDDEQDTTTTTTKSSDSSSSLYGLDTGIGPGAAVAAAAARSKNRQQDDESNNKSSNQSTLSRFLEEGPSSSDEPIILTNSIYLHEAKKMHKSGFAPSNLKGRVVLCKVFLGRSFPEAPELSTGMTDADLSAKLPKIDGKKVLPPEMHAVMRFKKGAGDVVPASAGTTGASSSSNNSSTRQRVWFVYRNELVLPEYVVHFDYKTAATASNSSNLPVGDISNFPWLNSNSKCDKIKEEYLTALRSHNLVDPTRRGDLDAVLNRASAAAFAGSGTVSSSSSSSSSSSNNGPVQQNTNDLLLMTPALIFFATKSAEMVASTLKACSSVVATVSEKVESLRKTNSAIMGKMTAGEEGEKQQQQQQQQQQDQIEALVAAHSTSSKNTTSFIHLFSDWSLHNNSKNSSNNSPQKSTLPSMQLLRSLAGTQWSTALQVLVLPFAALGPELPASELAGFELSSLVELDLSFNALREFHFEQQLKGEHHQHQHSNSYISPFNAPNLLRLNLSENELHHPRDLLSIAVSHPKLQHAFFFGNEFPTAAVDDYVVSTQFVLETLDGSAVHERLTELRSLPSSLATTAAFFAQHPTWFDLSLCNEGEEEEQQQQMSEGEADCFTLELLPVKFTRRGRMDVFVDERIKGALRRATADGGGVGSNSSSSSSNDKKKQLLTLNISALRLDRGAIPEFSSHVSSYSFALLRRLDLSRNNIKNSPFKFLVGQQQQQQQHHHHHHQKKEGEGEVGGVCPQLEFLSLAGNRISSIRCLDMFAPSLRSVDVQGNELSSLIGLPVSIQVVYAEGNRLSTLADVLRSGPNQQQQQQQQQGTTSSASTSPIRLPGAAAAAAAPAPLSRATELYLADNLFHACRDIALPLKEKNNGDLFILDLSRNRFRDGEADAMHFALCNLPKIKVYNGAPVDAAQLQTAREVYAGKLSEELLIGKVGPPSTWKQAQELNFANMALREIDLLSSFAGLQHLVLESNLINDLSPLNRCVNLQSLDVSFNRGLGGLPSPNSPSTASTAHSVGLSLARARSSLCSLALEGCNIFSVASLQLGHLPSLRFLNLKNNEIQDMSEGFEGLPKLQELVLDQNKIKAIDGLGRCGQLARLSLDENLVKSLEGVRYVRALTYLSVAMNRVADLNEFENVALSGSFIPGGATNADNASSARPVAENVAGGSPFYTQQQQQQQQSSFDLNQQQQQQQLCNIDTLNVQSNPCMRKLGNPAYRILCVRMIPSLRTIDGVYVSQDEFDRALPPPVGALEGGGGAALAMMMPSQQLQQQQQPLQPMVQPLTTFKMMDVAGVGSSTQQQTVTTTTSGFRSVAPRQQQPAVNMNNALNMYGYGGGGAGGSAPAANSGAAGGGASGGVNSSRTTNPATSSAAAAGAGTRGKIQSSVSSRPLYGSKARR